MCCCCSSSHCCCCCLQSILNWFVCPALPILLSLFVCPSVCQLMFVLMNRSPCSSNWSCLGCCCLGCCCCLAYVWVAASLPTCCVCPLRSRLLCVCPCLCPCLSCQFARVQLGSSDNGQWKERERKRETFDSCSPCLAHFNYISHCHPSICKLSTTRLNY